MDYLSLLYGAMTIFFPPTELNEMWKSNKPPVYDCELDNNPPSKRKKRKKKDNNPVQPVWKEAALKIE